MRILGAFELIFCIAIPQPIYLSYSSFFLLKGRSLVCLEGWRCLSVQVNCFGISLYVMAV